MRGNTNSFLHLLKNLKKFEKLKKLPHKSNSINISTIWKHANIYKNQELSK